MSWLAQHLVRAAAVSVRAVPELTLQAAPPAIRRAVARQAARVHAAGAYPRERQTPRHGGRHGVGDSVPGAELPERIGSPTVGNAVRCEGAGVVAASADCCERERTDNGRRDGAVERVAGAEPAPAIVVPGVRSPAIGSAVEHEATGMEVASADCLERESTRDQRRAISAGNFHTCGLVLDGAAYC